MSTEIENETSSPFNKEQQEFIDYIMNVMNKDIFEPGMIRLVSPGGTGKTYCIKYLKTLFGNQLTIIAPTHKSVSLFPPSMKCTTIHKFFSAAPSYEADGSKSFDCHTNDRLCKSCKGRLIVVDEASMINTNMFECFKTLSEHGLVIFTGDNCQLPPIGEEVSPIFNNNTIKEFRFVQNMRSKDSLIREYNRLFRGVITHDWPTPIIRKEPSDTVRADMLESFKQNKDTVILSWRNITVNHWNQTVRKHLFMTDDSNRLETFYPGEQLIFSGYRSLRDEYPVKNLHNLPYANKVLQDLPTYTGDLINSDITFHSNDEIIIQSVEHITYPIPYYICSHQEEERSVKKYKKCDICGLPGRVRTSCPIHLIKLTDINGVIWYSVEQSSRPKFNKLILDFKKYIQNCTEIKYKNEKSRLWVSYYKIKETFDAVLKYKYAMTTHLAQGSQFDHVYVDLLDIRVCPGEFSNKIAYTAVSRAVETVHFL